MFSILKFKKVAKKDLWFLMKVFIKREEYEKCSAIKEMLDLKFYDNNAESYYGAYALIVKGREKARGNLDGLSEMAQCGADVTKLVSQYHKQLADLNSTMKQLWNALEQKDGVMLKIPFKNKNNLGYLFI